MQLGVIFDVDGTLLDSMNIWMEAGARYLRGQGRTPEPALAQVVFHMTLEESARYMKARYALTQTPAQISAGVLAVVADFYRFEAGLKPGAADFLRQLQAWHIPMALATTGDRLLVQAAMERLGVWDMFAGLFTCAELHTTKREALIYQRAAALLHTPPHNTWVFEDVLPALQAAAADGFHTAAIADGTSRGDWPQMQHTAELFLCSWADTAAFYRAAGLA